MFTLPELPYAVDALEPIISARIMALHHDKHHQTYVTKLNEALADHPELLSLPIADVLRRFDTLPEQVKLAVRNHGGGHSNHSVFWQSMIPGGTQIPDQLSRRMAETFGSTEEFRELFTKQAAALFGSGWTWLIEGVDGALSIKNYPNQDSPFMQGDTPILGLDVWEHAYYLQYENRRADYIEAWWGIVDWVSAASRLQHT